MEGLGPVIVRLEQGRAMPSTEPLASTVDGMDMEGLLRSHGPALILAPSGETVPGLSYAEDWQDGTEGRTRALRTACDLLDQARPLVADDALAAEIGHETAAMRAATRGRDTVDSSHLYDWNDKPHRLLYDAAGLMERAADALAASAAPSAA